MQRVYTVSYTHLDVYKRQVIAQVRSLTGQAPMFPLWTYGYWQSKERYKSQKEVVDVVRKYRELGDTSQESPPVSGLRRCQLKDDIPPLLY